MKSININFADFWPGFNVEENFIVSFLRERYIVNISSNPDYIFYSVFGSKHLNYDCVKIFYTGENESPNFNLCDYAIGFDPISFGDRYCRFPYFCFDQYSNQVQLALHKHESANLNPKTGFCTFVVSNPLASECRTRFFDLLSKYKKVDSGGKVMNNVGGQVLNKYEFLSSRKFNIAFENTSHPGYCTEKIVEAFAAGTVPIYWGDPEIGSIFNKDAFVNVQDYPSFEKVIEEIIRIDNDDDLYLRMLGTPAFIDGELGYSQFPERLKDFLANIFDQPISSAYRRDRCYWNERYLRHQKRAELCWKMSPLGLWAFIFRNSIRLKGKIRKKLGRY